MKHSMLLLFCAAVALAQVPAHSVSGAVTVDVSEVSVPVPYGPAETRAVVSVCSQNPAKTASLDIYSTGDYASLSVKLTQFDTRYCGSVVLTSPMAAITSIDANLWGLIHVVPPPPPPPVNR